MLTIPIPSPLEYHIYRIQRVRMEILLNKVNPASPDSIPKFVTPLPKPVTATPRTHKDLPKQSYYELSIVEGKHRFHKDFPPSTIWGYNGMLPGPTIEARKDKSVFVKYVNRLPARHFLPIDKTLHGASDSPEVRTVVHLHGAHVDWKSDGHPEAWYTKGYEITGPKFTREIHEYTNHQPGTTLWYHDHTMGITRLNVYAGLAGFYLLRDALEDRLKLPKGKYEIPLMIQDKTFNEDGSLFYPDQTDPPAPVHPSITLGMVGNTIVVNGKVWPYLQVEPRKYRFRMLNASNRRGYVINLSNGQPLIQIGTDGGFLRAPIEIPSIELLPAERADFIIDFSNYKGEKIILMNSDEEFADDHTNVIMQFTVDLPLRSEDTSEIPTALAPSMDVYTEHAHTIRNLPLTATTDEYGRLMLLLNNHMYHDPATEKPALDSIEIWNLINTAPVPHPIHIHLIQFKILERQPFDVELFDSEGIVQYTGDPEPPKDYEQGWKDTVKVEAGSVTKLIMHWKGYTGNYIWHCHYLEHEDHDMMRPITVIPDTHPVQPPHPGENHNT